MSRNGHVGASWKGRRDDLCAFHIWYFCDRDSYLRLRILAHWRERAWRTASDRCRRHADLALARGMCPSLRLVACLARAFSLRQLERKQVESQIACHSRFLPSVISTDAKTLLHWANLSRHFCIRNHLLLFRIVCISASLDWYCLHLSKR